MAAGQFFGVLNINKPEGITSHDVVARVRKITRQRKVGHTGTLDPMATGVLIVCVGQATRLIEYMVASRKQYRATLRFGITTDTLDADGQVVGQQDPSHLTEAHLKSLLPAFEGDLQQRPPIFSALKQDGRPLYKRARAGEAVQVAPRPVTIHRLTWLDWQPPDLTIEVTCSAGTYIRALARDVGEAAGVGAHLVALTRTANGPWTLENAVSLETLAASAGQPGGWQTHAIPPDQAIAHLPRVILSEADADHVRHGRPVTLTAEGDTHRAGSDVLRAYTPSHTFLAILRRTEADGDTVWQPKKVFQTVTF